MFIKLTLKLTTVCLACLIICLNYITVQLNLTQGKLKNIQRREYIIIIILITITITIIY